MHPYINITLPTYGVCMATAMILAVAISCLRAKKRGIDPDRVLTLAIFAIVAGIIGAKLLFFIVTYTPKQMIELIRDGGITAVFEGGLVFYGGLIGGVLGAMLGARAAKTPLRCFSDPVVPVLPLAHAIGRLGCFFAGCCYGKVTDSWIGVCFPAEVTGLAEGVKVIPTQLIEAGVNILVFIFLIWFTGKHRRAFMTLFVYIVIYGVERFIIEFLRGDEIRGFFGFLSTSQWISIALIVIGVAGIIFTLKAPGNDPDTPEKLVFPEAEEAAAEEEDAAPVE